MGLLRIAGIAVVAAALASALPAPARAATITAEVKAKVVKPLTLTSVQNFDLGTLVLGSGTWSNAVVSLSRAGVLTCPANVTCSGTTLVALYNLRGSAQQTVTVIAPNVTLVNQSDPTKTLTLVIDKPSTVTIPNSGAPGVNFPLGGSISVNSTTVGGDYVGTFDVSVNYQ